MSFLTLFKMQKKKGKETDNRKKERESVLKQI